MLHFVSIENFALIQRLRVEFKAGLNLITGETGSGKSILVDAVGLLVGSRASQEMVRQGHETARVEGLFSLVDSNPVWRVLDDEGIDCSGGELVIRREIWREGANRVFINDRLATLSLLAQIGRHLVDIHGQHSQQALLSPGSHLTFLDAFGRLGSLVDSVATTFESLQKVRSQLEAIRHSEQERLQRLDLLNFQANEISGLGLRPGLDRELQQERDLLASAESRLQAANEAYRVLYENEDSVLSQLTHAQVTLEKLAQLDIAQTGLTERLREALYLVEEAAFQARDYRSSVEFDPRRLEQLEERLSELERAKRKYGCSGNGLLNRLEEIEAERSILEHSEEEIGRLEREEESQRREFIRQAEVLSSRRREAGSLLCTAIEQELADLAMAQTVFQVLVDSNWETASKQGIDTVEFLISANPGEEPKALARVVSGGELSRVMLALKGILEVDEAPRTLVFDEVDAGIGGGTATSLGGKLARVAQRHQVFCVTHLPQIAAFARQHFYVDKRQSQGRTIVEISALDEEARIRELARMLAGEQITSTTIQQARELLKSGRVLETL